MQISFGIVTNGGSDSLLSQVIQSIHNQNIPEYEIIIVGTTTIVPDAKLRILPFDETIKNGWISRKKNIFTHEAKYDILVQLHDYIALCPDWYTGFLKFGSDFKVCGSKVETIRGKRFRDFTLYPAYLPSPYCHTALLPYTFQPNSSINKLMYISGAYMIFKKDIALNYLWNEDLCWGMGDDLELCHRLTNDGIFLQCNPYSTVKLLKEKHQCEWEVELSAEHLKILSELPIHILESHAKHQRDMFKALIQSTHSIELYKDT